MRDENKIIHGLRSLLHRIKIIYLQLQPQSMCIPFKPKHSNSVYDFPKEDYLLMSDAGSQMLKAYELKRIHTKRYTFVWFKGVIQTKII